MEKPTDGKSIGTKRGIYHDIRTTQVNIRQLQDTFLLTDKRCTKKLENRHNYTDCTALTSKAQRNSSTFVRYSAGRREDEMREMSWTFSTRWRVFA